MSDPQENVVKDFREAIDLLEAFLYPPWEFKNIINPEDVPGPGTRYIHDPAAKESFARPLPPSPGMLARAGVLIEKYRRNTK